jgi:hypothetical protein
MTWTVSAAGPVTVSGFTIVETGTAAPTTDILNVKVGRTTDNGAYDGADVLVGTGTWSGSSKRAAPPRTRSRRATKNPIVTADASGATTNNVVTTRVDG